MNKIQAKAALRTAEKALSVDPENSTLQLAVESAKAILEKLNSDSESEETEEAEGGDGEGKVPANETEGGDGEAKVPAKETEGETGEAKVPAKQTVTKAPVQPKAATTKKK